MNKFGGFAAAWLPERQTQESSKLYFMYNLGNADSGKSVEEQVPME